MPAASSVAVYNALTPGVLSTFVGNYDKRYAGLGARLAAMMDLSLPSDGSYEIYPYFESAPYPTRWDRGNDRDFAGFKDVSFTVYNLDWNVGVLVHENDLQDDRTKSIMRRAMDAGTNMGGLPERVLYQMMTGATDAALLQAIPNAPDGAAPYSATDGTGAARFGATGGNLLTGSGVATSGAVQADFFSAMEQIRLFKDTKSQPLFDDDIVQKPIVITYNAANDMVFREAFLRQASLSVVQNVAATENVAAAAPSNVILASGLQVTLMPTQRITDNDWFVFFDGCPVKPFFQQKRQAVRMLQQAPENSDRARLTKEVGWMWDSREGYGTNLTFGTLKVNN
jgi:phage major head subunit gpT-like protein